VTLGLQIELVVVFLLSFQPSMPLDLFAFKSLKNCSLRVRRKSLEPVRRRELNLVGRKEDIDLGIKRPPEGVARQTD
jgi:hypothetical protein